jgi:hypothetical protein
MEEACFESGGTVEDAMFDVEQTATFGRDIT